jgi:two-component system chemotaxis response regulator CheY
MNHVMDCNVATNEASSFDNKLGLNLGEISALILEKSEIMRLTLSGVLHSLGIHDQRSTGDPKYAFDLLTCRPADIIFSDWSPGLDGIGFLTMVRSNPRALSPYTPVIMVSANTDPRHIFAARDSGMTEYVAKPYTAKRIYDRVWEVIERQRKFIKNASFFGPDRRRHKKQVDGMERRKSLN